MHWKQFYCDTQTYTIFLIYKGNLVKSNCSNLTLTKLFHVLKSRNEQWLIELCEGELRWPRPDLRTTAAVSETDDRPQKNKPTWSLSTKSERRFSIFGTIEMWDPSSMQTWNAGTVSPGEHGELIQRKEASVTPIPVRKKFRDKNGSNSLSQRPSDGVSALKVVGHGFKSKLIQTKNRTRPPPFLTRGSSALLCLQLPQGRGQMWMGL